MTASYYVTVTTGLEFVAEAEIRERLAPAHTRRARGKVFFTTDRSPQAVCGLRAVENLYAFAGLMPDIPSDEAGLERLRQVPLELDWSPALQLWRRFFPRTPDLPSFRVTAQRSGSQSYRSPQVAAAVGAGLVHRFGWRVDLTGYDLEVHAHLAGPELLLGLTLTRESLYRRHRAVLGVTALKPSIAYALARLAGVGPGETLVDPMCGVGTIPIEAALAWPEITCWAGDVFPQAVERAALNIRHTGARVELARWDVRCLPLAGGSVDAIACDLPFGRRIGSHRQNRRLYPAALQEMARVLRPGGKAVLLTLERRLMEHLLGRACGWERQAVHTVNVGGLQTRIYRLRRG